mgnify:CR=1 FL=1
MKDVWRVGTGIGLQPGAEPEAGRADDHAVDQVTSLVDFAGRRSSTRRR